MPARRPPAQRWCTEAGGRRRTSPVSGAMSRREASRYCRTARPDARRSGVSCLCRSWRIQIEMVVGVIEATVQRWTTEVDDQVLADVAVADQTPAAQVGRLLGVPIGNLGTRHLSHRAKTARVIGQAIVAFARIIEAKDLLPMMDRAQLRVVRKVRR